MKTPVSAIILTYNEEKNLSACLNSLHDIVEEIIIVDSYSNDKTLEIVKKYTDKIYQNPFSTHSKQWKWAIDNISLKNEWIFAIDADQRISPELNRELKELFRNNADTADGYYINRKQIFLGRWIKYGT